MTLLTLALFGVLSLIYGDSRAKVIKFVGRELDLL